MFGPQGASGSVFKFMFRPTSGWHGRRGRSGQDNFQSLNRFGLADEAGRRRFDVEGFIKRLVRLHLNWRLSGQ